MALAVGTPAPEFSTSLDDGRPFRLSDLRGRQELVLFFYPRDFSGGCTKEACSFRDRYEELQAFGAFLLGVSPDADERHVAFRAKHDLPFPLAADPEKRLIRAYDVSGLFGLRVARVTYVIDREGIIRAAIHKEVQWSSHSELALEALAQFRATAP